MATSRRRPICRFSTTTCSRSRAAVHANYKARPTDKAPYLANAHAIPLTVDEFIIAQRYYPIVFSAGENPVPLALMGLNEGVNVFIDDEGKPHNPVYIPAYVRRYPFMLARLDPTPRSCRSASIPTSDLVGEFEDGKPLFDGDKPSETLNGDPQILRGVRDRRPSAPTPS